MSSGLTPLPCCLASPLFGHSGVALARPPTFNNQKTIFCHSERSEESRF